MTQIYLDVTVVVVVDDVGMKLLLLSLPYYGYYNKKDSQKH